MSDASPSRRSSIASRSSRRSLFLCAGLVVAWGLLIRRFGGGDVYPVLGAYALAVIVVVGSLRFRALRAELRSTPRAVISGLAIGVGMTLATYPIFDVSVRLFPSLRSHVAELYRAAATRTVWQSLPWVVIIIVAEELLFRGALLEAFKRCLRPILAMTLAVAVYAMAQAGTGSSIVALMALVCGAVWTVQRHLSKSLLSPLISHLIWTPVVILLRPVL